MELVFLPPYSPEMNLIEGLWKWLKSAVIYNVFEHYPVQVKRIGVREQFGQVGKVEYLKEFYKLTSRDIVRAAIAD